MSRPATAFVCICKKKGMNLIKGCGPTPQHVAEGTECVEDSFPPMRSGLAYVTSWTKLIMSVDTYICTCSCAMCRAHTPPLSYSPWLCCVLGSCLEVLEGITGSLEMLFVVCVWGGHPGGVEIN